MPKMRKCKECGKLFQPKGREQYCSALHYRPCPVCGEPVLVKYLSDPPRRCANCRASKAIEVKPLFDIPTNQVVDIIESTSKSNTSTSPSKSPSESVSKSYQKLNIEEIPPEKDIRKFIGKDYKHGKGFLPKHLYELSITKDEYSYWVSAVYDWTANKEVNITELFSSKISIDGHFQKLSQE